MQGPGQEAQSTGFQDKLERQHPAMLAALSTIWPENPAKVTSRFVEIRASRKAGAHQEVDLAAIDGRFTEAQAMLSNCGSALRAVKARDPIVVEIVYKWPLLKPIFGI